MTKIEVKQPDRKAGAGVGRAGGAAETRVLRRTQRGRGGCQARLPPIFTGRFLPQSAVPLPNCLLQLLGLLKALIN